MSQTSRCPECGAELPTGETEGLCPKCLLGAGLDSDVDVQKPGGNAETTPQPGGFLPPEPRALAPHFPQLEILNLLGQGGMGAVYEARQTKLDRVVALKIIRPESADDPAFAERFHREAKTLARLNHPNIVAVHDSGEVTIVDTDDGEPTTRTLFYFLMEYVDGPSLRQLIQGGQWQPEQALAVVPQICEALQFAHDEGIVHRDIKPENILLDQRGRVKIADFGLAKLAAGSAKDFTLTATHQVMGTPRYMAPEQMEGSHAVDHRADIYSLGVVFYEMLTGQVPAGHFDPPSKKVQIDVRLDEVVLRSLAREPERRYQHASEIKTDVEAISQRGAGLQLAAAPLDRVAPAPSRTQQRSLGATALQYGLMLLVLIGGSWLMWKAMDSFEPDSKRGTGSLSAGDGSADATTAHVGNPLVAPEAKLLLEAAAAGQIDRVKQLLAQGVDINTKDAQSQTALMKAAAAGEARLLALLMLRGADETMRDKDGKSALMHAAEAGQTAAAQMLVDMDTANYDEEVQFRLKRIDPEFTKDLDFKSLHFEGGQKWQDSGGETALMKAAARGDADTFQVLFLWSDSRARDKQGRTALLHAIENRQIEFLKTHLDAANTYLPYSTYGKGSPNLLVSPESLSVTDGAGRTPLQIAEELQLDQIASGIRAYLESVVGLATQGITDADQGDTVRACYIERGQAYRGLGQTEQAEADAKMVQRN